MRNYALSSEPRKFTPRPVAEDAPPSGLEEPEDDPIPLHRSEGDVFDFHHPTLIHRIRGTVRKVVQGTSLIQSEKEWFVEFKDGKIIEPPDSFRCTHCGEYLCSCSTHHPK